MNNISLEKIEHNVTYRYIGGDAKDGILSCGFMRKKNSQKSQIDFVIPYYSCFVLLAGSGRYWDKNGFQHDLKPGCVVQRLPNQIHSTYVEGDGQWLEFYISFGKSVFDYLVSLHLLNPQIPVFTVDEPNSYLDSFFHLLSQMEHAPDHNLMPCLLNAQTIASNLTQRIQTLPITSPVILKACEILEKDLEKELSLEDVSKKLCLGYETFRKLFWKEMKQSPNQYRHQKRMTTAQMMLLEGQSIKSVAKALGYSDSYSFSKQFKCFCGISPCGYVKQFRKTGCDIKEKH